MKTQKSLIFLFFLSIFSAYGGITYDWIPAIGGASRTFECNTFSISNVVQTYESDVFGSLPVTGFNQFISEITVLEDKRETECGELITTPHLWENYKTDIPSIFEKAVLNFRYIGYSSPIYEERASIMFLCKTFAINSETGMRIYCGSYICLVVYDPKTRMFTADFWDFEEGFIGVQDMKEYSWHTFFGVKRRGPQMVKDLAIGYTDLLGIPPVLEF